MLRLPTMSFSSPSWTGTARIATGAVGMITTPELAEAVLCNGRADLIYLARAVLARIISIN